MKKTTSHRLIVLGASLTIIAMCGIFSVPKAEAFCNSYSNSRKAFFWDYGWACAYTGPGCSECVSGGTVCVEETGGHTFCWDYQDYGGN